MKIIVFGILLLLVLAITAVGCYVLIPIYGKPVSRYLAAKGDEAYTDGHYRQSMVDLEQASKLDPENAFLLNNFAWILATAPDADARDGKKAVIAALKACQLTSYQNAADVDTLAAAYAETGDFDNAVKWETKYLTALSLSPSDATDGQTRLALYQAHKPYHADQ
jgi:tetratricopeptide (TPR) repeat protein